MTRSRVARPALVTMATAALLALGLQSHASSSTAPRIPGPQTTTVAAAGGPYAFLWEWSPAEVTISKGERINWINPTSATHHITSWDGPWDVAEHLETDASLTLRFKKPGVYRYWCDISTHSDIVYAGTERICVGMCGVITVE